MPNIILKIVNVSKKFPGVQALDKVDLEVIQGEIHAIVGENGAGKSTLMNILSGVIDKDTGKVVFNGEEIIGADPRISQQRGISIVYQELALARNLTVMDNIFLWDLPSTKTGLVATATLKKKTQSLLESLGVDFAPETPVKYLTVSDRQIVEIAKGLSMNASMIIMDEPNSALSPAETQFLFQVIRNLRDRGVTTLFISHRLDEVFEIADRITVLRDGKLIGTKDKKATNIDEIISMMVGRDLKKTIYNRKVAEHKSVSAAPLLTVENISNDKKVESVSFELHKHEILGIFGLVGAGRTDVAEMLFGIQPITTGNLLVDGKRVEIHHPVDALDLGMAFLPEDRKLSGLFLNMSVADNINMASLNTISNLGLVNKKAAYAQAEKHVSSLDIRISGLEQKVLSLSGGNQQKAIIARWLAIDPQILILDEPTRGIDVGAKAQIYDLINELAENGVGVILISSELEELLALSDRILVMKRGKLTAEFERNVAKPDEIMKYAA